MKAWKCSRSVNNDPEPKEKCSLYKYATDDEALSAQKILLSEGADLCEACDMAEYELTPAAEHEARDAAIKAAEKAMIPARNYLVASAKCRPKEKRAKAEAELGKGLDDALAALRAAEGKE